MRAEEISAELARRMPELCLALLGTPSSKTRRQWRYGTKGSLVVELNGPKAGIWCSFEGGGGDPIDLIRHARGCSTVEALRWAAAWLGDPRALMSAAPASPRTAGPDEAERGAKIEMARRLWTEAVRPEGTLTEVYLRGRGLRLPASGPLRFHPRCPCGADRLPAMLALMTDPATNQPAGVHRTFLAADGSGKAAIPQPKRMLGAAGVIRLVPDEEVTLGLGITEGIENALSIMQAAGWAHIWACGSAGAIARFPVLAGIEALTIFADADDGGVGMAAARSCAERWTAAGAEVRIIPPRRGGDWNDLAREMAA